MSTRETLEAQRSGNIPTSGENTSDGILEIPSCTIEDIDRSVFELFDKHLPINYTYKKKTKRVPVVFAAGERFALIARKKPLRDKNNALILPVLSMMRSNLSANNEMGLAANQTVPHIIKKKLSRKDPRYQRIINKLGLVSSDDMPADSALLNADKTQSLTGAKPGRVASRRDKSLIALKTRRGNLLDADIDNNIFDVIEMPPPQFVTVSYEITVWAQYVQQMNDIVMAIMSNMQSYSQRTFRLETKKGYYFVGYMDDAFSPGNNFDDFSDDERIIRTSFTIKVPAYLIGQTYESSPNRLRSIMSSPQVTFEMNFMNGDVQTKVKNSNVPSGNPEDYILDDRNIRSPIPGQAIGGISSQSRTDPRFPGQIIGQEDTALIGGVTNDIVAAPTTFLSGTTDEQKSRAGGSGTPERIPVITTETNPFTGKVQDKRSYVKTRTSRNGEVVYREVI